MLNRLLTLIAAQKSALTTAGIAAHLGANADMVESLLGTLTDLGYLATVEQGCSSHACAGCQQAHACGIGPAPRLWTLTDKGQAVVLRHNQHLT